VCGELLILGKLVIRHTRSRGNLVARRLLTGFAPLFQWAAGWRMRVPPLSLARFSFRSALSLQVLYPTVDLVPVKTVVAADFQARNVIFADQSIDRAPMNVQVLGYLNSRHHEQVICGCVTWLHSFLFSICFKRNSRYAISDLYVSVTTCAPC
jgi:hypothetical protein